MSVPEPEAEAQKPENGGQSASSFIPLTVLQPTSPPFDLDAVRARLAGTRGPKYWRSLEELADTDEFRQYLEREFPHQAPRDWAPLGRREFFRLMGATLALAGVGGCSYQPPEKIVPYVEQPEELVPGKPLYYTTAFQRGGYAYGLLAESQMGRPVKLEGNPEHPASLGATDAHGQASLLGLYDPDRSQAVRNLGSLTTWEEFLGWMTDQAVDLRQKRGAGLRVLTETVTSPTLAAQLQRLLKIYPEAKLTQHEPVGRENVREGARQAFGEEVHPVYHFERAERILSLDSDFLTEEPGSLRFARDFSDGRRVRAGRTQMNRLYVVESTHTLTGANADHRLALRPSLIEGFARAAAAALGAGGGPTAPPQGVDQAWLDALVKDLQGHRGASLVVAGMRQPPVVHALAHAMNQALGNIGKTVIFTAPAEVHFGAREGTLGELVADMQGGRVDTLVILGSNPVYTAPADLKFGEALQKVSQRIHLGLYEDETSVQCQWHIPQSHDLEAWSDARAYDGTACIIQPLIVPLYATRSVHELLAVLVGEGDRSGYDIVREHWIGQNPRYAAPAGKVGAAAASTQTVPPTVPTASAEFEQFWHKALVAGTIPGTQAPAKAVTLRPNVTSASSASPAATGGGLEISFAPDPSLWDGRFANNGWLQELPKPLTQLTWDNAVLISPVTARAHQLDYRDMVQLSFRGQKLEAAIWIMPGHPDDAVTLYLGHGRTRAGRVGNGTGFNAYVLRASDAPWFGGGLEMTKIGGSYELATAQRFFTTHGRDLVRVGTLEEFTANPTAPEFMQAHEEEPTDSLYRKRWPSDGVEPGQPEHPPAEAQTQPAAGPKEPPVYESKGYNLNPIPAWGMVIDVNTCIGCNACVLACQAENNIATVGKDQVAMHRQMHWIRIDTYYSGAPENPETVFEPIPCMHCEDAPCEPVCPVEATSHSAEGINEQTYNRCIGTRYCQNNCPYKVRVFNYLQFSDQKTPTIQLMHNPDVTVRSRGVMEKCTYCVQRINEARIQAEKEDRALKDGDILTACQQVCPTRAITFGNINDTKGVNGQGSMVRQLKREPLNYDLLAELNTRPRTSYLAKLRNPNPDLKS